jgi:hypothetical protein
MQDHTRTQKLDTRNDALDDPACIGIGIFRYGSACMGGKSTGQSHSLLAAFCGALALAHDRELFCCSFHRSCVVAGAWPR